MSRLDSLGTWHEGRPWATNAVLTGLGLALLLLARQLVREWDHFQVGFSTVTSLSVAAYVAAAVVVTTQPANKWTFRIILGFAIAHQAMVQFAEPFSSSDIYRYVWDGVVQHAHVNPYRYVPGNPVLSFLRAPNQEVFDNMNRRDYARTIYPPVAQMVYWFVTYFSTTVDAMKMAMTGCEVVAGAALLAMLRRMGRSREHILLFAWCPLLIQEIGLAGHVDAIVIAFVSLALLFRSRNQPLWTGLFLGLAVFTKFYPIVLFPALYMRRDWKMPSVIVATGAIGYGLYSSAGKYVLGFAGDYEKEEGMASGVRYFLLQAARKLPALHSLPVAAYIVFCLGVLGALTLWAWRSATTQRVPDVWTGPGTPMFVQIAAALAFAMMLLFSPHYPWYVVWLVPFFTLMPRLPMMTYVLGLYYLLSTWLADGTEGKMYMLNERLYASVALAWVLQWAWRRWNVRQRLARLSS